MKPLLLLILVLCCGCVKSEPKPCDCNKVELINWAMIPARIVIKRLEQLEEHLGVRYEFVDKDINGYTFGFGQYTKVNPDFIGKSTLPEDKQ